MRSLVLTPSNPFQGTLVALGDTVYELTLRYNERDTSWYMDVALPDGTVILQGIKLVGDWTLIQRFHRALLPDGELFTIDTTGQHEKPTLDELGDQYSIIFATTAEQNTILGA